MTLLTSGCAIDLQICEKERLSGCHFVIWDTNFDITTKRVGHSKITISRTFENFDELNSQMYNFGTGDNSQCEKFALFKIFTSTCNFTRKT